MSSEFIELRKFWSTGILGPILGVQVLIDNLGVLVPGDTITTYLFKGVL